MKKIFSFVAAALMSVSMFAIPAVIPTVQDVATAGFDVANARVIVIYFDEEVCNDIVWAGSYNEWNTEPAAMLKFEPLENYPGWYVVEVVDESETVQGKPVQLKKDGSFAWDFQSGDADAWINMAQPGTKTAEINAGYFGEADATWPENGAYIYELAYFKNHNTPCGADNPKHNYTITAYLPDFCDEIAAYADSVRLMGGFDGWSDGIWMTKKYDEDFNEIWTATLENVEEGTEFRLRFGTDVDWAVQVRKDGQDIGNETTTDVEEIILQYNEEGYDFAACAAPIEYKYTTYENWQIKHEGSAWEWTDNLEKVQDGLFKLANVNWTGSGFNVKSDENPIKKDWFAPEELVVADGVIAPATVDVYLKVVDDETISISVGREPKVSVQFLDEATGLKFEVTSTNTVKVISNNYTKPSYIIPATVSYLGKTFNVTTIGDYAFGGCTGLTSITIPNFITTIGEKAFELVNNIVYNGTATGSPWGAKCVNGYVDGYLVYSDATKTTLCGCSSAVTGEITIPNSVTTIGNYAFYNCTGLTSIVIGSSVTYIGENAFYYCENLRTVYNNSDLYIYAGNWSHGQVAYYADKVYNGIPVGDFVIKRDTILTAYTGTAAEVTIPNYITTIGYDAFYGCSNLISVIIECTLSNNTSSSIFRDCPISSVTIGEEVQSLPYSLFGYSDEEKTITSVTWNAKNCSIQYTSGSSIFGKQVKSFVFGNNVKVIPSYCCQGMTNLTSMVIPNSVDSVGSQAFSGCTGLTTPVYNKNVFAFMPTSYVGSYIVPQGIKQIAGYAFYYCSSLTSVTIPNSVTTIGNEAFYQCKGLTSIEIPNSVTKIEYYAFYECTSLAAITAPAICFDVPEAEWPYYSKQLTNVVVNGGELNENELLFINRSYKTLKTLDVSAVTNTEFADEAFSDCYNLESLILPQSLERISYMMVAGCKNLKAIDIPASVVKIDQSAFEDCRCIKTITFNGKQLKTIGNWAFYNAHQLQNLTLPEGVEEIGEGAFYGCVYLEDLFLPRSIKSIGDNGFSLCSKLSKMTVRSVTPPTIEAKTFYEVSRQIPVYVPVEAINAYRQADYWKEFNIIATETPTDLKSVHDSQPTMHKVLRNGQILLERNNATYTLMGQKVR